MEVSPSSSYNEVCDLLAGLISEVCRVISVEPHLQPLSGNSLATSSANAEDKARLDVAASGFWGGMFERVFFDVRAFNPCAPSNQTSQIASSFRRHEDENAEYTNRESERLSMPPSPHLCCHAPVDPELISAPGTLKRLELCLLTSMIQLHYNSVVGFLQCRFNFCAITLRNHVHPRIEILSPTPLSSQRT